MHCIWDLAWSLGGFIEKVVGVHMRRTGRVRVDTFWPLAVIAYCHPGRNNAKTFQIVLLLDVATGSLVLVALIGILIRSWHA
jgi:hypothetical protein